MIGVAPPRDRIRVTLRYDLPEPPEPDLVADIVAHAVAVLRTQRLTAAVAARVAPLGGIAAESMRQATRRAEQHVARLLAKVRRSARLGAARHMIAAEGLAAVGQMITWYRGGGRFTSDYEIARITVALRDLRVRDDAWARMDPAHADAHLRLWIDVVRRGQPRHVAASAALLALAAWQSGHGAMQARPTRNGERQHDFAEWPPRSSTTRRGFAGGSQF